MRQAPLSAPEAGRSGGRRDADLAPLSVASLRVAAVKVAPLRFAPFRPPERPASGALSGAWRVKSLLGSVGRAVVAEADDDDDSGDDDSDGESEAEEEAPDGVGAMMENAVEDSMRKLAIEAQVFMCAVDKLLSKVEQQHKVHLLTGGALEDQLCKALTEDGVKQAAVIDILSTLVISPLLVCIRDTLPEVLSELPQPSNEANQASGTAGEQLLNAFKDHLLLGAGKAALLKRLSPIVSKWMRASRARAAPGRAVDEEQPLLQPEDSAKCLVTQLWPALVASLEAQARRLRGGTFLHMCCTYTHAELVPCAQATHARAFCV